MIAEKYDDQEPVIFGTSLLSLLAKFSADDEEEDKCWPVVPEF